ncbi:MAG: TfoX/Sxy family protein [Mycobacterium sp.]
MAYDAQLAARVRGLFADDLAVREQAMFGALAFLVAGRVAVAASADGGLLVRVDAARADQLLRTTAAQPIEMRGRTMRGWVHIDGEHLRSRRRLGEWIAVGIAAATSALGATP